MMKIPDFAKSIDFSDKEKLYTIITLTIIISIGLLFFSWITSTISLNNNNCIKYKEKYDDLKQQYSGIPIKFDQKTSGKDCSSDGLYCKESLSLLRNYYIKTAYNCCNADGYKNNWVHLCAMKYALKLGVRCLDFEIYSINDSPVIASSTSYNITFKETFNYIPLEKVMRSLLDGFEDEQTYTAFHLNSDPLLLHFRIKTQQITTLKKIGLILHDVFSGSNALTGIGDHNKKRSYKKGSSTGSNGVDKELIKNLQNKVIIMIDSLFNSTIKSVPELHEYVNLYSGTDYKVLRISQIDSVNNMLIGESKIKMHIVLPDLNNKLSNYDFLNPVKNGCQLIAMKFQANDSNLKGYLEMFNNNNKKSFLLKHHSLREDNYIFDQSGAAEDNPLIEYGLGANASKTLIISFTDTNISYQDSSFPRISITVQSYSDDIIIDRNTGNDRSGIRKIRVSGQTNYFITIIPMHVAGKNDSNLMVCLAADFLPLLC